MRCTGPPMNRAAKVGAAGATWAKIVQDAATIQRFKLAK